MVWCTQESMCDEGWDEESQEMFDEEFSKGFMRTCKGASKSVNKLVLKHDIYKKYLMDVELRKDKVQRIDSNAHQLYTYDTKKVSLCPFDDKRYVIGDKINTLEKN